MPMHTTENNAPTSSTCESEIFPPVLLESANNPVDFQGPLLTYSIINPLHLRGRSIVFRSPSNLFKKLRRQTHRALLNPRGNSPTRSCTDKFKLVTARCALLKIKSCIFLSIETKVSRQSTGPYKVHVRHTQAVYKFSNG